jgi:hypothetical protein
MKLGLKCCMSLFLHLLKIKLYVQSKTLRTAFVIKQSWRTMYTKNDDDSLMSFNLI